MNRASWVPVLVITPHFLAQLQPFPSSTTLQLWALRGEDVEADEPDYLVCAGVVSARVVSGEGVEVMGYVRRGGNSHWEFLAHGSMGMS